MRILALGGLAALLLTALLITAILSAIGFLLWFYTMKYLDRYFDVKNQERLSIIKEGGYKMEKACPATAE